MFSDVVLVFNEEKYFLASVLVKEYAPYLFAEFEHRSAPTIPSILSSDLTPEQVISNLTSLVSKAYNKKTINMTAPSISRETLNAVLGSMYGQTLEITSLNILEVYEISKQFGIKHLMEECKKVYHNSITLDNLFDFYQRALSEKSPLLEITQNYLIANMISLPRDQLLAFVEKLSEDDIIDILTSNDLNCNEDLVYEMADRWCKQSNLDASHKQEVMSYVKLDLLSSKLLVNEVKRNPYVTGNRYVQILEARALASDKTNNLLRRSTSISLIAIGKLHSTYDNYRLITKEEVNTTAFRTLFKQEYDKLNGIYSLDDFAVDLVCCQDHNLCIGDIGTCDYLRGNRNGYDVPSAKKQTIFQELRSIDVSVENMKHHTQNINVTGQSATNPRDTTGIFVSTKVKLI